MKSRHMKFENICFSIEPSSFIIRDCMIIGKHVTRREKTMVTHEKSNCN